MPGADASQFTRLKKALASSKDSARVDGKSFNRLSQYLTGLSAANDSSLLGAHGFLPSITKEQFVPPIPPSTTTTTTIP